MNITSLIVLGGFAGAGKTTMTNKLVRNFGMHSISTDSVNDTIRSKTGLSFHETSPKAHDKSWSTVRDFLDQGTSVILDTNMCSERAWQNIDELKLSTQYRVLPILIKCSLEVHKYRIDLRGATEPNHLNLGGDKFEDTLHKYHYIEDLKRPDLIAVNGNGSINSVYESITKELANFMIFPIKR